MNKKILLTAVVFTTAVLFYVVLSQRSAELTPVKSANNEYVFPSFYKGFYLNTESGNSFEKLSGFIERARAAGLNTVVLDVQTPSARNSVTPKKHVEYLIDKGFHPVARVVMFPDGLKEYPVPAALMEQRLAAAEEACKAGFKEIQLDYIRFNDHGILKHLTIKEKYNIIKSVVTSVNDRIKKYNVRVAVDIFGRIPLVNSDPIGQSMEVFDEVVDVICPMAYPSHYTWSKKMMNDPYYTVHLTSEKAKKRAVKSIIVPWIQAFQIKVKSSGLSYDVYIEQQIKAVHDAGVNGYIFWNASQTYDVPFEVSRKLNTIVMNKSAEKNTGRGV